MSNVFARVAVSLILVLVLVGAASYKVLHSYLDSPLKLPESGLEFSLEKGGSLSSMVYELHSQNVLESPRQLLVYSRITGRGTDVAAGEYSLKQGLTPRGLLKMLERGDVLYHQLTLVEGWNLRQVLAAVRAHPRLKQTIPDTETTVSAELFEIAFDKPVFEGMLFPDTYHFHGNTTDREFLALAYERLKKVLNEEWLARAEGLPYQTPYQALIMASLVEKETGDPSERAEIAGVFVRRLNKGMRLQTDPTIIYGLGPAFDGNLRSRHLKDASNIYNTYRHNGLPPTPIALAGREAITAALNPKQGSSLYFVAKGDGTHYFSDTLEEHQRAVRKYQIEQRRKDYSSAPKLKSAG